MNYIKRHIVHIEQRYVCFDQPSVRTNLARLITVMIAGEQLTGHEVGRFITVL
ncbi:hypothetical protein D3C87_2131100 [compost metagenome]